MPVDTSKNACYIITVNFLFEGKDGNRHPHSHTFVSLHGISTKRFRAFAEQRLRELYPFVMFQEDWGSQQTIKNHSFCG